MKFVIEIFKLTRKCVRNRICRRLCSQVVNSFARRQHLHDIAARSIDVDSIICRILLPCSYPSFTKNIIIEFVRFSNYVPRISSMLVTLFACSCI